MFPCCQLCYKKYISEEGDIDLNALEQFRNERHEDWKDHPRKKQLIKNLSKKICRCACHIKGKVVLH